MASRLYFCSTSATYTPTSFMGSWSTTSSAITKLLGTAHDTGAPATVAIAEAVTTNPYNVCWGRWVSNGIAKTGTLSGVVSWAVGVKESSLSANDFLRVHIWVTAGNTSTVRGTLLSQFVDTIEFTTTAAGQSHTASNLSVDLAITSTSVQAGDRIVVEIGYSAKNSVSTSFTGTMNYGGNQFYRDLVANGASTAHGTNPATYFGWVQFSDPNGVIIAKPPYRSNMCPNPSFKTYEDFWSTAANTTDTQVTNEAGFSRTTGLHVVIGTAGDPTIQTPVVPAAVGETWAAYLEVKGSISAGNTTTIWLNFVDSNSNFLSPNPSTNVTLTATPQVVTFSGQTAPVNTSGLFVSIEGTAAVNDSIDVSCVVLAQASTISTYADGDNTGWIWTNGLTDGDSSSYQLFQSSPGAFLPFFP